MTLRLIPLTLIAMVIVAFQTRSEATTPPESLELMTELEREHRVSPGLENWLDRYSGRENILELDDVGFQAAVATRRGYTRAYLELARANRKTNAASAKETFQRVKQFLQDEKLSTKPISAQHPLLPFVFYEMARTPSISDEERGYGLAGIVEYGAGTCSQKNLIYNDLKPEKLAKIDAQALTAVWQDVQSFRSPQYKKNALRRILDSIPPTKRNSLKPILLSAVRGHSDIIANRTWLQEWVDEEELSALQEPQKSFFSARRHARARRCSTAKSEFVSALSHAKGKPTVLDEAMTTGKTIGDCYRRRSVAARRDFWKNVEKPMEQAFGFDGWAQAQLRIGYLYWTADVFKDAKIYFHRVRRQAESSGHRTVEGQAVFALARVAENEGDLDAATQLYNDYVNGFADGENYEEALQALVLLYIDKDKWSEALPPLEKIITEQSQLAVDDRSTGSLSFSLYWAGRVHLQLGNRDSATEKWRRAASEYYSTFYGAISHYLHEKMSGQRFALSPARTENFRIHKFRAAFSPEDRRRIRRIQALAEIGARDEALCEVAELDMDDNVPEKGAMLALLRHAVGDWLEAIKVFDGLPRSYRHSLPIGFERILYPRRYVDEIQGYAKNAGVDPDMILAIIRQESVFNPRAFSPAGARGLMQLMPATAKLESRRLGKAYLPAAERQRMQSLASNKANLFAPNLNVALGVHHFKTLMNKYNHPVFALCAYNASPSAANRWRTNIESDDILAFVERIPYKETRGYVKLILRNYFYYKRWYEEDQGELVHLDVVTGPLAALTSARPDVVPNH